MFGARIEDGKWRLCIRRGNVIKTLCSKHFKEEIVFRSQAKAKATADRLNDLHWKEYAMVFKDGMDASYETQWDMIKIIHEHGGLADLKPFKKYYKENGINTDAA